MGQYLPKNAIQSFSKIELEQLTEHFYVLAKKDNNDKYISDKIFVKHFLKEYPQEWAEHLYGAFDFDRDGKVGLNDFLQSMTICIKTSDESRRTFIYRMFESEPGKLSMNTLKNYFPDPPQPIFVEAMWDFDKQHEKELGIKKGEIATVINKYDSTWWLLRNQADETGYVAASYVREIEPPRTGLAAILTDQQGNVPLVEFQKWAQTSDIVNDLSYRLRNFSIQPPPAFELGGPTNFRHQTHIGFNSTTGGFEFTSLPDEWKKLLNAAGITSEEAANTETTNFLVSVLYQEREKQIQSKTQTEGSTDQQEADQQQQQPSTEPTQQPTPEPAPSPSDTTDASTASTASAASTTTTTTTAGTGTGKVKAPPPPPPAPSVEAPKRPGNKRVEKMPEPGLVSLLDQIRSPAKLRSINPDKVRLDNLNEQETNDLVIILKKAMEMRRPVVNENTNEEEVRDEAEWED